MSYVSPLELGGSALKMGARFAWYVAQSSRLRRVSKAAERSFPDSAFNMTPPTSPAPTQQDHLTAIAELLRRDLANVRAGYYALPEDEPGGLTGLLRRTEAAIKDAPEVTRRRMTGAHQEVFADENKGTRPRYYLQNFHFQSDGWLSDESAEIYDAQVELLFRGSAASMRRQALRSIAEFLHGKDQRKLKFADVACGSGAFLRDLAASFPRLSTIGFDLSEPYLERARDTVGDRGRVEFSVADAEDLPLETASLDGASIIYLFHELPKKVRRSVAREMARVIKPGGRLFFVDSIQFGDTPKFDALLEIFPQLFHEPYYLDYCRDDLSGLFEEAGFHPVSLSTAYVSRVMVLERSESVQ